MIHKESTASWLEIGGKRCYFRSMWERNYCRYLQFLKERNQIHEWYHEPTTFWFEEIKRGVRSYKPDFQVFNTANYWYYVEVKGYYDPKSLTKIKRFNKYYPKEKLTLIDAKWFGLNTPKLRLLIPDWETGKNCLPKFKPLAKKKVYK